MAETTKHQQPAQVAVRYRDLTNNERNQTMAAVDYFAKFENPSQEGESTDGNHKNEIEVEEYHWEQSQEGTGQGGGGMGAGKVKMSPFRILFRTCKATPNLMLACANGQPHKTVTLSCRKAGATQHDYLIWTLSEVIVSKHMHTGKEFVSSSGEKTVIPLDEFHLNFGSIQCEYKVQKDDGSLGGSVKAGWNQKTKSKM
jgi:type VI secretion system secreted protein Hcp